MYSSYPPASLSPRYPIIRSCSPGALPGLFLPICHIATPIQWLHARVFSFKSGSVIGSTRQLLVPDSHEYFWGNQEKNIMSQQILRNYTLTGQYCIFHNWGVRHVEQIPAQRLVEPVVLLYTHRLQTTMHATRDIIDTFFKMIQSY